MKATIRRNTYAKLFDKLSKNPAISDMKATNAILGNGVEITFHHPYFGHDAKWYLTATAQKISDGNYLWYSDIYNTPQAEWKFDDTENTSVESGVYKLDSLSADALYDVITDYLRKAQATL